MVGVGASYKMGWGSDIQHVAITGQGVGLRSFVQIAIKGGLSATGGFEYNYTTPFTSYQQLKQLQYWTKSGLIGLEQDGVDEEPGVQEDAVAAVVGFFELSAGAEDAAAVIQDRVQF